MPDLITTPDPKVPEGTTPQGGKPNGDDPPVSAEDLAKMKAAHDNTQAELRVIKKERDDLTAASLETQKRLKILEEEKAPKETGEKIAVLERDLARSKAVSRHGLSEEDAERLTGSPEQILQDAEYWSKRTAKPKNPDPLDPANPPKDPPDPKVPVPPKPDPSDPRHLRPAPKPGDGQSWMEKYKASTPADRYKMDQDVLAGRVDPTK